MEDFKAKVVAAALGVVMGWVGTSLTMVGRVEALEAGQKRIESALGVLLVEVRKVTP